MKRSSRVFLATAFAQLLAATAAAAPAPARTGVAATPTKRQQLSSAVSEVYALDCPASRIEIESERR